jgi:hypothetical protein
MTKTPMAKSACGPKRKRAKQKLPPIHPGEILLEDYMKPLGLSAHRLAMALHVPATRVGEIVNGRRAIRPIPQFGLGGTSIQRPVFGSIFKLHTTWN